MKNTFTQLNSFILLLLAIIITSTAHAQPPSIMTAGTYTLTGSFTWYDSGGSGGTTCPNTGAGNYGDNLDIIETITANTGQQIVVTWVGGTFGIASGDTLKVYNGATTSDPIMATYTNASNPIPTQLGATTNNSVTFHFTSNDSLNCKGWQATIAAYYFMQPGIFTFSCPGSYTFVDPQSENSAGPGGDASCWYSVGNTKDYRDSMNIIETFTTDSGKCIQVDPSFPNNFGICFDDTLKVFDGPSVSFPIADNGNSIFANSFSNPSAFYSLGNAVTFEFRSNGSWHARGWQISLSCVTCLATSTDYNYINSMQDPLIVYPNPASDYFNVNTSQLNQDAEIEICDLTGRKIESHPVSSYEMQIGESLANGVYFLKIVTDNKTQQVIKLVKNF